MQRVMQARRQVVNVTRIELLEEELREVNAQLYAAYKRIKKLNEQHERDEKYIKHLLGECPPDCKLCGE